jgi:phosphomevalonate kinase
LRYRLEGAAAGVQVANLPAGLAIAVYFSGASARTSDLLERVARATAARGAELGPVRSAMRDKASEAARAVETADAARFVACARDYGALLAALGTLAGAPIVPPACAELAGHAEREAGAFLPSGAGGGDVSVWIGPGAPSASFDSHARDLGLGRLALSIDTGGVRPALGSN